MTSSPARGPSATFKPLISYLIFFKYTVGPGGLHFDTVSSHHAPLVMLHFLFFDGGEASILAAPQIYTCVQTATLDALNDADTNVPCWQSVSLLFRILWNIRFYFYQM